MAEPDQAFQVSGKLAKVDDALGLVFGYAIICTEDGEPYYDLQDEHFPEDVMLKSALDFVQNAGVAGEMHVRNADGEIVGRGTTPFLFPLTTDLAKALEIKTSTTGLLIAMKPDAAMLAKFKSGQLTGFSVGGMYSKELVDAGA